MPSYYYTKFQKNPCLGRNERCPLVNKEFIFPVFSTKLVKFGLKFEENNEKYMFGIF